MKPKARHAFVQQLLACAVALHLDAAMQGANVDEITCARKATFGKAAHKVKL